MERMTNISIFILFTSLYNIILAIWGYILVHRVKFNFAADQMVNKARAAAANLKIVMSKSGIDSYSARNVL